MRNGASRRQALALAIAEDRAGQEVVNAMEQAERAKMAADPRIGARVELHPACDLWMRGARFGTVVAVKDGTLLVRMDNRRVRKLQRFTPNLLRIEGSGEYGLGYMQGRGAS